MSARTCLTRRQSDLLTFIRQHGEKHGIAPTFEEMGTAIGTTKSHAFRLVGALEDRGLIRRLPNRARTIEIVEREPTLPPDLERRVANVCEALQIDRREFEKRSAECFLNKVWAVA